MEIRDRIGLPYENGMPVMGKRKAESDAMPLESLAISGEPAAPESCPKVFGALGATVGGVTGRLMTLPLAGAYLAASAVTALGGGVVLALGASILGLAGGVFGEYKSKLGRILGGMLGGVIGAAAGEAASLSGFRPSEDMAHETRAFSLKSLPSRLRDPQYTSHALISAAEAKKVVEMMQPGDLLITSDDRDFKIEIAQKIVGATGDWTHIAIVDDDKKLLQVLKTTDGASNDRAEDWIIDNTHVMLLRPRYKDNESLRKTLEKGRQLFGKVKFDLKFDLRTDDRMYCQEYVYKIMKETAPEIKVELDRFLGRQFVSADSLIISPQVTPLYSSGSNYWKNLMSKYD